MISNAITCLWRLRSSLYTIVLCLTLLSANFTEAQTLIADYPLGSDLSDATSTYGDMVAGTGVSNFTTESCSDSASNHAQGLSTPDLTGLNRSSFQIDVTISPSLTGVPNAVTNKYPLIVLDTAYRSLGLVHDASGYLYIYYDNSYITGPSTNAMQAGLYYDIKLQYINGAAKLMVNNVIEIDASLPATLAGPFDSKFYFGDNPGAISYTLACFSNLKVYNTPNVLTPETLKISSISPASAEVGDTVTITGTGFDTTPSNNIVYFGGVKATVTAATSTQLTVTVPAHSNHAPISVNVNGLIAQSSLSFSVSNADIAAFDVSNTSFEDQNTFASVAGQYTTLGSYATDKLVAVGDFDGDGKVDVVKSGSNSTVSVHLNTGTATGVVDGNTFAAGSSFNIDQASWTIEVADIDGDGKLDIISSGGTTASILRNTSTGTGNIAFDSSVAIPLSGSSNLEIMDVDSDGKLDLVVSGSYASNFRVKLNTSTVGAISFEAAEHQFGGASGSRHFTSGDLDNDGKPEVILLGSNAYIYKNNSTTGTPSFSLDATVSSSSFNSVVADFDGDGDNDILGSNGGLIENVDASQITTSSYVVTTITAANIGYLWGNVGDYNGDGKVDYTYGYRNSGTRVNYMLNDVTGGAITSTSLLNYQKYSQGLGDPIFVDVDGDHKLDIITSGHQNAAFYVLRNRIGEDPFISITENLNTFEACSGEDSASQSITVAGTNLTANITMAALSGYEYSLDDTTFTNTLTFTQTAGEVAATTVYVRMVGTTSAPSGNIVFSSTGATSVNLAVTGSLNTPAVPTVTDTNICIGDYVDLVNFATADAGHTLNWFDNGTPLGAAPTVTGTVAGDVVYQVSQTNTTTGCTSATVDLTVSVGDLPDLTANGQYIFYQNESTVSVSLTNDGETATYTVSPALPTGLTIDANSGTISGTPTVISAEATYTITAETTLGCIDTADVTVSVIDPNTAPILTSFNPTQGQPGDTVVLSGINLQGVTAVDLGGVTVTDFTVDSHDQITVTIPNGVETGVFTVTNTYGSDNGESVVYENATGSSSTGWSNARQQITNNANVRALTEVTLTLDNWSSSSDYNMVVQLHDDTFNMSGPFTTASLLNTSDSVQFLADGVLSHAKTEFNFDGTTLLDANGTYYILLTDAPGNPSGDGYQRVQFNTLGSGGIVSSGGPVELRYSFKTAPAFQVTNLTPVIADITDQTMCENGEFDVTTTITDTETTAGNLQVEATSSDESILTNAGISITNSGDDFTFTLSPEADATGTVTVTVTVTDEGNITVTDTFNVTVSELPTVSTTETNYTFNLNQAITPITFDAGESTFVDDGSGVEKGFNDFPFTSNGITVDKVLTGDASNYASAYTSCSTSTKANSIFIGTSSAATFKTTFTSPVNNLRYRITGADLGEVLTITTSNGAVNVSLIEHCNTTVTSNQIAFTGGNVGAIIEITNSEDFSWIEFSHNGGAGGLLMTLDFGAVTIGSSAPTVDTWSVSPALPTGLSLDTTTGEITGTPTVSSPATDYTVTGTTADGCTDTVVLSLAVNAAPVIADITDQTICQREEFDVTTAITDTETTADNLTVTATSSDQSILTNAGISITNSGDDFTLTLSPEADATGTATVTVSVTDEAGVTVTDTFDLTVKPTPSYTDQTLTVCDGEAFDFTPAEDNGLTGVEFTWTVSTNPEVSGAADQAAWQTSIAQTLNNTSGADQTITYTVTPRQETTLCDGTPFDVVVTVKSAPVAIAQDITVQLDANGEAVITADMIDNGSSGGCGVDLTLSIDNTSFNCSDITSGPGSYDGITTLSFDGVDDYVSPTTVIPQTSNHSVTAWIKSSTINRNIFGWGGSGINNYSSVSFLGGNLRYYAGNGVAPVESVTGSTNVLDGQWHHVAITRSSAGEVNIYVDGALDATGTVTKYVNSVTENAIGATFANVIYQGFFNGQIDDLSVWSSVLSESEVQSLVCSAPVVSDSNLLAYYNFEDGTNSTTLVDTTSSYNAVLNNMDPAADWVAFGTPVVSPYCSSGNSVTLTVTDDNGNTATDTATVTIVDSLSPIFESSPSDITVSNDPGSCGALVQFQQTVLDLDQPNSDIGTAGSDQWQSFTAGETGFLSTVEVFTNGCYNSRAFTMEIYEGNGTGGTQLYSDFYDLGEVCSGWEQLNLTSNVQVQSGQVYTVRFLNDIHGLVANYSYTYGNYYSSNYGLNPGWQLTMRTLVAQESIIVSDNCNSVTVTSSHDLDGMFDIGTTNVTLTATDESGNTETASFTVTVEDTTVPTVITQNIVVALDENGEVSITTQDIDNGSTDECGIDTISLNVTDFDCADIGDNTVTLTVTDVNGNTETGTAIVTVEDTIAPTVVTQDITVQLDANGAYTLTPAMVDNGSSDNCSIASMTLDVTEFTCADIGANTVTLTVTDGSGNVSTDTATVTVEDTIAPMVVTQDIVVELDTNGNASITTDMIDNGSTDNCAIDTIALDITEFSCVDLGNNTVTLTVTDTSGNQATGTANVTITTSSSEDPVVAVAQDITVPLNANGLVTITPEMIDNGSYGSCDFTLTVTPTTFGCNNVGPNTVILLATDLAGNQSFTTATVTIEDTTAPTVMANDVTVYLDENGEATVTVGQVDAGSDDNCSVQEVGFGEVTSTGGLYALYPWESTNNIMKFSFDPVTKDFNYESIVGSTALGTNTFGMDYNPSNGLVYIAGEDTDDTRSLYTLDLTDFTRNVLMPLVSTDGSNKPQDITMGPGGKLYVVYKTGALDMIDPTTLAVTNFTTVPSSDNFDPDLGAVGLTYDDDNNRLIYAYHIDGSDPYYVHEVTSSGTVNQLFTFNTPLSDCSAQAIEYVGDGICAVSSTYGCDFTYKLDLGTGVATIMSDPNESPYDSIKDFMLVPGTTSVGNLETTLTFDCSSIGENEVTLTAVDASGNASTTTATVTVLDAIAPTVITQDVVVELDENGQATVTAQDVDNGSYDNCPSDSSPYIYFTGVDGDIWKASKDGTLAPELLYEDGNSQSVGIEVDESTGIVYYGGGNYSQINVLDLNTMDTSILPGSEEGSERHDFEIYDGYVYYTSDGDLWKADIATGNVVSLVSAGDVIAGITLDRTNGVLYYVAQDNSWGIGKVDIDGSNVVYDYINTTGQARSVMIDETTQTLYWVQKEGGHVWRSPADASTAPEMLYDMSSFTAGIGYHVDLSEGTLYWVVFNDGDNIFKAPIDGSGPVETLYSGDFGSVRGIAAGRNLQGGLEMSLSKTAFDCSDVGSNTVVLTVTDASGNVSTATAEVTVEDNLSPTVVVQDLTVALNANGEATITASDIDAGSTDNCGIDTMVLDVTAFDCSNVGANTVTLTVTDSNGNVATATATVTVEDTLAPTVITEDVTVYLDANGMASITVNTIDDGSSDNCGIDTMVLDVSDFDCTNIGDTVVTLTVTDTSGNVSTGTATVTVLDTTAPVVATQDITIALDANGLAVITTADIDSGSTDNCGIDTMSLSKTAFDCSDVGSNTVVLTVTDASGNVSTATAEVTVEDNLSPTVVVQDLTVALNANGQATITVSDIDAGSTDNCGIDTMVLDVTAFDCSNVGANTVTLTVTDSNGNVATATATVTVEDTLAPTVITEDVTVYLDANGMASITVNTIDDGSSDNCGIDTMVLDVSDFDCTNIGDTVVTLTVTDTSGNVSTGTATVTVLDTTAPMVATQDITIALDANGLAVITTADIDSGSTDNCGIDTMSLSKTAFDCSDVGSNTVVLTVTDASGNVSTATAEVTVEDNLVPTVVVQDLTVALNANGQATITVSDIDAGSTDNCGIDTMVLDVTAFDCSNVGANTVTLTVTDSNGNVATATATVTVEDTLAPTVITEDVTVYLDANGMASITVNTIDDGSSDNCGIDTMVLDVSDFDCTNIGDTVVTLTVTDTSGNVSTGTATVTVVDNTAPTAIGQDLVLELDSNGEATLTADMVDFGSFDNCSIVAMSVSQEEFTCSDLGDTTVAFTVEDGSGHTNTVYVTVTVMATDVADNDGDGLPDVCDPDDDNDGVHDEDDNCPDTYNPNQEDRDGDGIGDACDDDLSVYPSEGVTPNGDGINDTWNVYGIEQHPNNEVRVYNRWGHEVFYARGYVNDWNGHYKNDSQPLPDGSYYYQLDLDGNGSVDKDGWIYITRL